MILEFYNLSFEEVAQKAHLSLARSTIKRIAHSYRDPDYSYPIVRAAQPIKLTLSPEYKEIRLEFAD